MYEIIRQIIDHAYDSQYSGEQSYIYTVCGVLIIVLTVWFLGEIIGLLQFFRRK